MGKSIPPGNGTKGGEAVSRCLDEVLRVVGVRLLQQVVSHHIFQYRPVGFPVVVVVLIRPFAQDGLGAFPLGKGLCSLPQMGIPVTGEIPAVPGPQAGQQLHPVHRLHLLFPLFPVASQVLLQGSGKGGMGGGEVHPADEVLLLDRQGPNHRQPTHHRQSQTEGRPPEALPSHAAKEHPGHLPRRRYARMRFFMLGFNRWKGTPDRGRVRKNSISTKKPL